MFFLSFFKKMGVARVCVCAGVCACVCVRVCDVSPTWHPHLRAQRSPHHAYSPCACSKSEIPATSHKASKKIGPAGQFLLPPLLLQYFYLIPMDPREGVRGWGTGSQVEVWWLQFCQIMPIVRVLIIFAVFWSFVGHFSALFPPFSAFSLWTVGP